MKLYCDRCNNTGFVDCHCGGDLCVCTEPEIDCPACGRDVRYDEVDDDWTEPPLPPVRTACPFCREESAFVEQVDFRSSVVICDKCDARGPECQASDVDEEPPGAGAALLGWNANAAGDVIALKAELSRIAEIARDWVHATQSSLDDFVDDRLVAILEVADEALSEVTQ